jgi:signal transduction histidine kinase
MVAAAIFSVVVVGGIGISFYFHSQDVVSRLVKERLRDKAAIAALNFSGEEVDQIRVPEDIQKPFVKVMWGKLSAVRNMPGILDVYILRRTEDPQVLEFVLDADLLASFEELDNNGNGVIESWETSAEIGERYAIDEVPALQVTAFRGPTTDEEVTHDKWGATISGYAPIRRKDGTVAAVIGIDMSADEYADIIRRVFSLQTLFLLFIAVTLVVAFVLVTFWKVKMSELRRLDDERTCLLELVLHQVGSPLTIFKWGLESLKESLGKPWELSKGDVQDCMAMIEDGVTRLQHVTDVLLTADRIQSGTVVVRREDVSLRMIIDEVIATLKFQLGRRRQQVRVVMPEDMHLKLDRQLLAGVLRELLDNAMIYSPSGTSIEIRARRDGRTAEVQIVDRGVGISKNDLHRIFERFVRGSNASRYDPNGAGIGLFIARGIIERFGGKIFAESREGEGTTITIRLLLR